MNTTINNDYSFDYSTDANPHIKMAFTGNNTAASSWYTDPLGRQLNRFVVLFSVQHIKTQICPIKLGNFFNNTDTQNRFQIATLHDEVKNI